MKTKEYFTEEFIEYFKQSADTDRELYAVASEALEEAEEIKDLPRVKKHIKDLKRIMKEISEDYGKLRIDFTNRFLYTVGDILIRITEADHLPEAITEEDIQNIVCADPQTNKALELARTYLPDLTEYYKQYIADQSAKALKNLNTRTVYTKKDRKASEKSFIPNDLLTRTVFSNKLAQSGFDVINPQKRRKGRPINPAFNIYVEIELLDEYVPRDLQPYFNAVCTLWSRAAENAPEGEEIHELIVSDNDIKRALTGDNKAIANPAEKIKYRAQMEKLNKRFHISTTNETLKKLYGITEENKGWSSIAHVDMAEKKFKGEDGLFITAHRYKILAKPYLLDIAEKQDAVIKISNETLKRDRRISDLYIQVRDYLLSTIKGMKCGNIRHKLLLSTLYEHFGIDEEDASMQAKKQRERLRETASEVLNIFKEKKLIKSWNFETDKNNAQHKRAIKIRFYGGRNKKKASK